MFLRLVAFALLLAAGWSSAVEAKKRIAFTFDDVPRQEGAFFSANERTAALIDALRDGGVEQAGFFVTTGNLDKPDGVGGEERIGRYVAAGHVIGNHSHSHLWLHRTDADTYIADIDKAAPWLKGRAGLRPCYRLPYLVEGRRDFAMREEVRAALR